MWNLLRNRSLFLWPFEEGDHVVLSVFCFVFLIPSRGSFIEPVLIIDKQCCTEGHIPVRSVISPPCWQLGVPLVPPLPWMCKERRSVHETMVGKKCRSFYRFVRATDESYAPSRRQILWRRFIRGFLSFWKIAWTTTVLWVLLSATFLKVRISTIRIVRDVEVYRQIFLLLVSSPGFCPLCYPGQERNRYVDIWL